ncbi:hypothetical protein [Streptomyces sp. NPDC012508]|uniref:hypothetical protein n=1 Tax=Streptomyces sp. NPDC012508 TaxID=3364837 RepID=UPI0036A9839F
MAWSKSVPAHAEGFAAGRGLGDVPVEQGGQIPAPGERGDLVGVDVREIDVAPR